MIPMHNRCVCEHLASIVVVVVVVIIIIILVSDTVKVM